MLLVVCMYIPNVYTNMINIRNDASSGMYIPNVYTNMVHTLHICKDAMSGMHLHIPNVYTNMVHICSDAISGMYVYT